VLEILHSTGICAIMGGYVVRDRGLPTLWGRYVYGDLCSGGLRSGVAKGQSDPALEAQIFSAPQGQLVGPFKAQAGFYVIEVEKITPASTTPLSKASAQIKQQLAQGRQQEIGQTFQQDFLDKWRSRTSAPTAT
jgi:parvulin-like peptidyl-prolyl isomerase